MKLYQLYLLSLLGALVSTFTIANAQTKFGIQAGVNFSDVTLKEDRVGKRSPEVISGLRLGLSADIPLSRLFSIQPAFYYARKGYQREDGVFGSGGKATIKADYIELPVNLIFKPAFLNNRLFIGAGPYIGYGLGGNWKSETGAVIGDILVGNKGDVIFRNDAAEGGSLESYVYGKPLDYGASFLVGYELFSRLSVQVDNQLGLANLTPKFGETQIGGSLKNNSWGISLGYKF